MNAPEQSEPGPPAAKPVIRLRRSTRRGVIVRILTLLVALVGLYYLWPQLVQFFDALPSLATVGWQWFALMLALEVASFACYWGLMRIAVGERRWIVVAMAQLASTAASRVVPGGAASGGAVNYQMFTAAGLPRGRVATGVAASTMISTAVLFLLPVFAVPAILGGAPIDRTLMRGLEFGLVIAALIVAGGALALFTDRPVRWTGRQVERAQARVRAFRRAHAHRSTATLPSTGSHSARRPLQSSGGDLPSRLIDERNLIKRTLGDEWWKALAFAAGWWLFDFAALTAALAAVGAQPRPSLVLLGYVVAALLAVIPLTPGGVGFVEIGLAATLGLAGVGAAEATTAVLAYRLVSFWLPIPIGLVTALLFRRRSPQRPA